MKQSYQIIVICKYNVIFNWPSDDITTICSGLDDTTTGVILLVASLILLCVCLTTLVKTLQSLLLGRMAQTLKKHINSDLPDPVAWLTGSVINQFLIFILRYVCKMM